MKPGTQKPLDRQDSRYETEDPSIAGTDDTKGSWVEISVGEMLNPNFNPSHYYPNQQPNPVPIPSYTPPAPTSERTTETREQQQQMEDLTEMGEGSEGLDNQKPTGPGAALLEFLSHFFGNTIILVPTVLVEPLLPSQPAQGYVPQA